MLSTLSVSPGLYYATSSIIVNHPKAELVFEAGVRIMFRPSATIHVSQGTLQILGTGASPVVLAPTSLFSSEYGDPVVVDTNQWGGLYFGPDANSTTLLDTEYIDGSLMQHCRIVNAGYDSVLTAAVSMDGSTVLMDNVAVEGSGNDGVYVNGNSGSDMVLKDVTIVGSIRHGLYANYFSALLTLNSLNITGSGNRGAYLNGHGDVRLSESHFSQSGNALLYSNYGTGDLNVSSR